MDYVKLSEESLDVIMEKIRAEINNENVEKKGIPEESTPKSVQVSAGVSDLNKDTDWALIDKCLNDGVTGKQIGLYKAPMNTVKGLLRPFAKIIQKVYLRIAELTNRDIREFNGTVLTLFHTFKRLIQNQEQILNEYRLIFMKQEEVLNDKGIILDEHERIIKKQETLLYSLEREIKPNAQKLKEINQELQINFEKLEAMNQELQVNRLAQETKNEELNSLLDERIADVEKQHFSSLQVFEQKFAGLDEGLEKKFTSLDGDIENRFLILKGEIEQRSAVLVEKTNQVELRMRQIDEKMAAIKSIVTWVNHEQFTEAIPAETKGHTFDNALFYHEFEEQFRGTQADIKERLSVYLPTLLAHFNSFEGKKCIDIGCGRGEWMDLLKENGCDDYVGVDLNEIQLSICREKGHPVILSDCVKYIAGLDNESVDMIVGIQIIEHLPLNVLLTLLHECKRVLRNNGIILFETPNPNNLITAATYFYTDPTHIRPLHKDVVKFFVEHTGYTNAQILEVNPVRYSKTLLSPVCFDGNQDIWNENINQMNQLLYGSQDYAILGVK